MLAFSRIARNIDGLRVFDDKRIVFPGSFESATSSHSDSSYKTPYDASSPTQQAMSNYRTNKKELYCTHPPLTLFAAVRWLVFIIALPSATHQGRIARRLHPAPFRGADVRVRLPRLLVPHLRLLPLILFRTLVHRSLQMREPRKAVRTCAVHRRSKSCLRDDLPNLEDDRRYVAQLDRLLSELARAEHDCAILRRVFEVVQVQLREPGKSTGL